MTDQNYQDIINDYRKNQKTRVDEFKKVCIDTLKDADVQIGYPMWDNKTKALTKTHYPDGSPVTWCNRYFLRVASLLGYPADKLMSLDPWSNRPNPDFTTVDTILDNLIHESNKPNGIAHEVSVHQGRQFAMYGCCVAVIKGTGKGDPYGHVCLFYPDDQKLEELNFYLLIGAGGKSAFGIKTIWDVFLRWKMQPRYFLIMKQ